MSLHSSFNAFLGPREMPILSAKGSTLYLFTHPVYPVPLTDPRSRVRARRRAASADSCLEDLWVAGARCVCAGAPLS